MATAPTVTLNGWTITTPGDAAVALVRGRTTITATFGDALEVTTRTAAGESALRIDASRFRIDRRAFERLVPEFALVVGGWSVYSEDDVDVWLADEAVAVRILPGESRGTITAEAWAHGSDDAPLASVTTAGDASEGEVRWDIDLDLDAALGRA
jgi:hypothetical protein